MTEVDSQCLRKGTTRMPQKILKLLLQTAGQHLGVLRGSVCQSLDQSRVKSVILQMLFYEIDHSLSGDPSQQLVTKFCLGDTL